MSSRCNGFVFFAWICAGLTLLFCQPLAAQITAEKGAIRISISDPQGASIAGAKVTVTSPTGASQAKESDASGNVVFPLLDAGLYQVTAEDANFRRTVLRDVAVHVTEVTNLSVSMEIGSVTSEVIVSGDAAQTVKIRKLDFGIDPCSFLGPGLCVASASSRCSLAHCYIPPRGILTQTAAPGKS